ncbi:MAG: N-acetylmuramoyl-L-alanine amidase-like domain-containing protein [Verrucomicrobium sp.]
MSSLDRRDFCTLLTSSTAALFLSQCSSPPPPPPQQVYAPPPSGGLPPGQGPAPAPVYRGRLPWTTVFKGEDKFQALCARAQRENWAALPLGQRTATVGRALVGTRYGNYTLEIDDRIEAPSVNLYSLDCWTFYECSLAFSRMIATHPAPWSPVEMLRFVELERYRGGRCDGTYLSRMHHLEEVFADNQRRGMGANVTRSLGGVPVRRNVREMQIAWKSYRYLRNNPSLRSGIAKVENRVSRLPVSYIPRERVARIESRIQDGDVLAIVSRDDSGYTSHVGLAVRQGSTCRFMHATSSYDKGRCCIVDTRISSYLGEKYDNLGLVVFRPA